MDRWWRQSSNNIPRRTPTSRTEEGPPSQNRAGLLRQAMSALFSPRGWVQAPSSVLRLESQAPQGNLESLSSVESALLGDFLFNTGHYESQHSCVATATSVLVPHVAQMDHWDCGLACLLMILKWVQSQTTQWPPIVDMSCHRHPSTPPTSLHYTSRSSVSVPSSTPPPYQLQLLLLSLRQQDWLQTRELMRKIIGTDSVWTIDLVLLLQTIFCGRTDSGVDIDTPPPITYLFCSKLLQFNETYNRFQYYRHAFSADQSRVPDLFARAREARWPMLQTSHLDLHVVVDIVSRQDSVAIALVDCRILNRSVESDANISSVDSLLGSSSYSGHYILLCGISTNPDNIRQAHEYSSSGATRTTTADITHSDNTNYYCFVIHDPGKNAMQSPTFVTPEHFEQCWRAEGTDDDIIFVRSTVLL